MAIHFLENGKIISEINTEDQVDIMKNTKYEFAYLGGEPIKGIPISYLYTGKIMKKNTKKL